MFRKEEVEEILAQAQHMDSKYEMFGVSAHQYKLHPPVDMAFVREMEERYHFRLPEDYVQFITEVGDGGAGPDYGLVTFGNFLRRAESPGAEKFREAYRCSLANAFLLLPMKPEDLEYSGFSKEAYKRNPEKYFIEVAESYKYSLCDTDGYFKLGTHGCQWDFGLVTAGERRGQIFDTDNEGNYRFVAASFYAFYQDWLDYLMDIKRFQKDLEKWRRM